MNELTCGLEGLFCQGWVFVSTGLWRLDTEPRPLLGQNWKQIGIDKKKLFIWVFFSSSYHLLLLRFYVLGTFFPFSILLLIWINWKLFKYLHFVDITIAEIDKETSLKRGIRCEISVQTGLISNFFVCFIFIINIISKRNCPRLLL